MFSNGVSPGTSAAKFIARTKPKALSGSASSIVISPVLSLVSIPEMSASALPSERYLSAPSITS